MTNSTRRYRLQLLTACGILVVAGCQREERTFRNSPPSATAATSVSMSDLQPGRTNLDYKIVSNAEGNAYAVNEGKKLYESFGCAGCHFHGGGGIGPPLMDDRWIYGSDPENVFSTIMEGRPNGMPSFRGRIPADRIWWIVAYVRSMSALTPKLARTSRDDDMMYTQAPMRKKGSETPRGQEKRGAQR